MNPVKIPFPEREIVRPVCRPGEVMRGEESWSEQTVGGEEPCAMGGV